VIYGDRACWGELHVSHGYGSSTLWFKKTRTPVTSSNSCTDHGPISIIFGLENRQILFSFQLSNWRGLMKLGRRYQLSLFQWQPSAADDVKIIRAKRNLINKIYMSYEFKGYGTKRLIKEFPTIGWKTTLNDFYAFERTTYVCSSDYLAHRARDTIELLRQETPSFIPPDLTSDQLTALTSTLSTTASGDVYSSVYTKSR